ncbi:MAG: thioredoxin-disulfide reductase [Chloroflexota bacterium]
MQKTTDVVIVGAGPAGLTAALYTGRGNLGTIIVEKMGPGGELLNTELIEDYPGLKSITGHEMAQIFEEQALEFGATIEYGTVTEIYSDGKEKVVKTDEGDEFRAKAVIVCSGGTPRKLEVPGEAELAGRGVSYCAICDGAFFKGQVLAVVGGGDAAVEEATFLTRYASKVLLIHRRDKLRAERVLQERLFANEKIEVIWNTVVEEISGDGKVERIKTRNTVEGTESTIDVGGIFIYVGFDPTSNIFRDPIELDEMGFIITDDKMETSQPGIFCAGDVRHQFVRQITNATGDATTAAVAVTRLLESLQDEQRGSAEPGLTATAGQYP